MKLAYKSVVLKLASWGLLPTSILGRVTLYLLGLDLVLFLVTRISRVAGFAAGSGLTGWIDLLTFVGGLLLFIVGLRWVRRRLMWRLRNRLIITYMFIGVIPVVLLLAMGFLASYIFGGLFAIYLATSDIEAELRAVQSVNSGTAAALAARLRRGEAPTAQMVEGFATSERMFPNRQVTVWFRGKSQVAPASTKPVAFPPGENDNLRMVASDGPQLYFRALRTLRVGNDKLTIISSIPFDKTSLDPLAGQVGELTLQKALPPEAAGSGSAPSDGGRPRVQFSVRVGDDAPKAQVIGTGQPVPVLSVTAGAVPPKANRLDFEVAFPGFLTVMNWATGANEPAIIVIHTRPALLYRRLAASFGADAGTFISALIAIGIALAMVELLALIIGIRLTRTMTRSVAELYSATQRINRGDFRHRIPVKSQDQLAALETSFNSMTESIERLLLEQQEKQRMENELAIAQEVQAQLFPQEVKELGSLAVHGVCRPARTVSGDYYDFLPLGAEKLAVAVGDISGKGISAALLMATIHSAVRAYSLERVPVMASARAVGAMPTSMPFANSDGDVSPAALMAMLNRQLYASTPAEKYATLFLGIYDGRAHRLTYCNAGHLPPIIMGRDGSLRRLDCGGTVTGLFGDVTYDESTIEVHPGEMLLAYSDGVTEPENEFGEFGEERLIELVRENLDLPLARISDAVLSAVSDWIGGNEQPDDVTLVLARAR